MVGMLPDDKWPRDQQKRVPVLRKAIALAQIA
jgi:hypothetical protein